MLDLLHYRIPVSLSYLTSHYSSPGYHRTTKTSILTNDGRVLAFGVGNSGSCGCGVIRPGEHCSGVGAVVCDHCCTPPWQSSYQSGEGNTAAIGQTEAYLTALTSVHEAAGSCSAVTIGLTTAAADDTTTMMPGVAI